MKINVNKVKQIPKAVTDKFGVCAYGKLSDEVAEWMAFHKLESEKFDNYTNVFFPEGAKMSDYFEDTAPFEYIDGFSPNLNKHLHVGHLANLVAAKALHSMGVAETAVAILGDTLGGEVSKEDALTKFKEYCDKFGYTVGKMFYASEMKLADESLLFEGEGEYAGTKCFSPYGPKFPPVVGVKSDGSTTYFYQDVVLAKTLNAPTLYLTGSEQANHFEMLSSIMLTDDIEHLPMGLLKVDGKKMSSRDGNVIMAEDMLKILMDAFDNDHKVAYNVFAGFILKAGVKSEKNVNIVDLSNPLNSPGLYLSYTLAKLKSAGLDITGDGEFASQKLQYKHLKAKSAMQYNQLFEELVEHAKDISALYVTHHIKGNESNQAMFKSLGDDLLKGMKTLGMMDVNKV